MIPKISVIIPVYNVENYLRRCLDSILNQNFQEMEIICVDDGSTDKSGQILDEYAKKDRHVIVLHQENARQAAARNHGLDTARGEYIAFIDADDYFLPDTFSTLIKTADASGADIVRFYFHYEGNNAVLNFQQEPEGRITGKLEVLRTLFDPGGPNVWSKLWKREFLEKYHIRFVKEFSPFEDVHFCSCAARCNPEVTVVKQDFYAYIQHPESSMGSQGKSISTQAAFFSALWQSIADWKSAANQEITNYLFSKLFEYLYGNYFNGFRGKKTEEEFFYFCLNELKQDDRNRFYEIVPLLSMSTRNFFHLLFLFGKTKSKMGYQLWHHVTKFLYGFLHPIMYKIYLMLCSRSK